MKRIWDTSNITYKAALKDWHKGTSGGLGIDAAFESWGEDEFAKYEIDLETYDHTNVVSRPVVLFHNYSKERIP